MQKNEQVIKCNKGWCNLYIPVVNRIIAHDLSQVIPNKKIGISTIRNRFGYLDIKVINEDNLTEPIISAIRTAQIQSEGMCEFCGTTENVGTTALSMHKTTCCEECYNNIVKIQAPLVSWKKNKI